ncbi:MAG: right-handed parallel beta-helix repeat-containing protein [Candidatus Aenigmatarchaeota archaeon]
MKRLVFFLILGAFLLMNAAFIIPSFATDYCNLIITNDTTLDEDLTCSSNGLIIGADNITLDCAGHSITGDGSPGYGINNIGYDYITVKNCIITGFSNSDLDAPFSAGIRYYEGADYGAIINNTVTSISEGISLYSSSNNNITNNIAISNANQNIMIRSGSNNNIIANNTATDSLTGIYLGSTSGCNDNTIINNNVSYNIYAGISLDADSNGNIIENNTANYNGNVSIGIWSGSSNILTNNIIVNNFDRGLFFDSGSNNAVNFNKVYNNTNYDLYNTGSGNNFTLNYWGGSICNAKLSGVTKGELIPYYTDEEMITLQETPDFCGCGDTITIDTTLTQDYTCPNYGIIIGADNITLDCDGYNLTGSYSNAAISLSGRTNVTVKNCVMTNFQYGIVIETSTNSSITNNTADGNTYGIYLNSGADSNNITNNTVTNNYDTGIYFNSGSGNAVNFNKIYGNTNYELYNLGSDNNITLNYWGTYLCNAKTDGIDLENLLPFYEDAGMSTLDSGPLACICGTTITENTTLAHDYVCGDMITGEDGIIIGAENITIDCDGHAISGFGNYYGINNMGFDNVTVKNCNISSFNYGIYFYNEAGNGLIYNNTVSSNSDKGIYLDWASNNNITNNTVTNNQDGIYLESDDSIISSANNTLADNIVNLNNRYGIYIDTFSSGTVVSGNDISGNLDSGIYFYSSIFSLSPITIDIPEVSYQWTDVDPSTASTADNEDKIIDYGNYTLQADDGYFVYELPFTFPFMGRNITNISVNTNGLIELLSDGSDCMKCGNPGTHSNGPPYDGDMVFASNGDLRTDDSSDTYLGVFNLGDRIVIEWNGTTNSDSNSSIYPIWFQVVMHQNGTTEWNFNDMDWNGYGYDMFSGAYANAENVEFEAGYAINYQTSFTYDLSVVPSRNSVSNNTISNNNYGIYLNEKLNAINYNSIFNNSVYDLYNGVSSNNLTLNYLGEPLCSAKLFNLYRSNLLPYYTDEARTNLSSDLPFCFCDDTITSDMTLTKDYTCPVYGITIGADDITLDCNGYNLTGSGSNAAISISGRTNVTVKNCVMTNFDYGIVIDTSTYNNITNNTANGNNFGIYMNTGADSNTLTNNTVANNYNTGIYFNSGSSNAVNFNKVYNNTNYDLYNSGSDNNFTLNYWGNVTYCNNTISGIAQDDMLPFYTDEDMTILQSTPDFCACGATITEDKTLTRDYTCPGNGIIIGAENITIDCDGHSITGPYDGYSYGISLNDYWNSITIKNCNIKYFGIGIYLDYTLNSSIVNNSLSGNVYEGDIGAGIYLIGSAENLLISGNHIFDNEYGIYSFDCMNTNTTIISNTIENNNMEDGDGDYGTGIYFYMGDNNSITNNTIRNNTYSYGLYDGATNTNISGNSISDNYDGLYLDGSDSILGNNNISSNSYMGIRGSGTGTNWTITQRNVITNNNISISGLIDISGDGVLELINSYLTYNGAFISQTGNLTTIPDGCGGTITSSKVLANDISTSDTASCVTIGADNIVLDCNGHMMTGDNATNTLGYGIYASGRNNVTVKNCSIRDFSAGIRFESVINGIVSDNNISNNGYEPELMSGIYMESSTNITVSNNRLFDNDIGVHISTSTDVVINFNVIENNNFELPLGGSTGYGILNAAGSANISNNNISGNNEYGIHNTGVIYVYDNRIIGNGKGIMDFESNPSHLIISDRTLCKDNDMLLVDSLSDITFDGGVLELDNCTLTINGSVVEREGNITGLSIAHADVEANQSEEFAFDDMDSNITLNLIENVSVTISIVPETPNSTPSSGLSTLKGIDIEVDNSTSGNLTWALIKIFYNESELTEANINESTLKIYYYNTTSSGWQLEPDQGVYTANNYVWANVTHFSLFGAFGSAPVPVTPVSPAIIASPTGGGCMPKWNCTDWGTCSTNGTKARKCTDLNRCGIVFNKPNETESCAYAVPTEIKACEERWECTAWSWCINNERSRTCNDLNICNTDINKSVERETCTDEPEIKPPVRNDEALALTIAAVAIAALYFFGMKKLKKRILRSRKKQ